MKQQLKRSSREKEALDQIIQSYLESSGYDSAAAEMKKKRKNNNSVANGGDEEHAVLNEFEVAYFKHVVGGSQLSVQDIVSVSAFEKTLSWISSCLDIFRPKLLALAYFIFVKRYCYCLFITSFTLFIVCYILVTYE
jgi:hypothetical protein